MMIGAANSEPETPWLEMVKVPPGHVLAGELLPPRPLDELVQPGRDAFQVQHLHLA
jgi:hypothetical protein